MTARLVGTPRRSQVALAASALLVAVVLAGCGGSSSTAASSSPSATTSPSSAAEPVGSATSPAASVGGASPSAAGGSAADQSITALVPAAVRQSGEIKVATGSGYPPFEFYAADNKTLVGVDPEIMQALGTALGLKITLTDLKFDAIIPGLQSNRYDVGSAAMSITPVRNKTVDFVSYFKGGTSLIVKAGNPSKLTLDTMCGHKIAVQKGTVYADDYLPQFTKACTAAGNKEISVDVYPDQPQATLALSSGRAEASMSDYGPLAYVAQQAKGQFEALQENYKPSLYGLALPKGSALAPAIQAGLKKIMADGSYQKILQKWQVQAGAISDPTISTQS